MSWLNAEASAHEERSIEVAVDAAIDEARERCTECDDAGGWCAECGKPDCGCVAAWVRCPGCNGREWLP